MSKSKRVLMAIGVAAAIAGCGSDGESGGSGSKPSGTPATGEPQKGGALTVAIPDPIDGWDPALATQLSSYQILKEVMEPLVRVSADGQELVPGLAESWSYDKSRTKLTLKLQPDAAFSNGDPVTPADVAFSVEQWQAGQLYAQLYGQIAGAKPAGKDAVTLTLAQPSSMVLPMLSWANSAIVPKDFAGQDPKAFAKQPIGAGPFMIDSEKPGSQYKLVRNPHYYDTERPYLDELTYDVVADNNQRLLQLEGDQVGLIDRVPLDLVERLPDDAVVDQRPSTSLSLVVFSQAKAPTNDAGFRKAVSLAVDRQALIDSIYGGKAEPAKGALVPNVPGAEGCPACDWSERDVAAAKDALAGSDYDGGPVKLLVDSARGIDLLAAQAMQPMLEEAGIEVAVEQVDSGTFLQRLSGGDYEMAMGNYNAISPTAADPLSFVLATGFLFSGAKTDGAMAAFGGVISTDDPAAQAKAVAAFEKAVYKDTTVAPLLSPQVTEASSDKLGGLELQPSGLYNAADLWLAK